MRALFSGGPRGSFEQEVPSPDFIPPTVYIIQPTTSTEDLAKFISQPKSTTDLIPRAKREYYNLIDVERVQIDSKLGTRINYTAFYIYGYTDELSD